MRVGLRVGLPQLRGVEVGCPDRPHLARRDQLVEHLERLRDRRHAVGTVIPVVVDDVGAQPPQRGVDRLLDVGPRSARTLVVAHIHAELRGEDDLVPAAPEHLAEVLLAGAAAVDVGGVEERDTLVERGVDDRAGGVEIDAAPEVVAPQPDDRRVQS